MRKSLAILTAVGLAATMGVALAGPAGAKGSPKGPKPPPKETKCAKSSQKAILYSATQFFIAPTAAGKTAYVDQGAKLTTIVDQSNTAAKQLGLLKTGQNTIPAGLTITCTGKTGANFVYDIDYQDITTGTTAAPLGLHLTGQALLKKGVWLISPATVCDLTQLESSQYGAACYTAVGLPVPPPS